MSVLSAPWPSPWTHHQPASFSALAAPVIPPLDPLDSPFPSPAHLHDHAQSPFSALAAPPSSSPRRTPHPASHSHPQVQSPGPAVPPRNTRSLDRTSLIQILTFLSTLLPARFGTARQIRLVIHGGAVMLLNESLARLAASSPPSSSSSPNTNTPRTTTRDIDYIARAFAAEWAQYGVYDANERLRLCALETARLFGLGADWLNSDADVALPMATECVLFFLTRVLERLNPRPSLACATGILYSPASADSCIFFFPPLPPSRAH
ncbi:hypothetical protein DFH07DRAFT_823835 [Mycena maculata]|uniref:Uncharacterized protein n=1 Tax=Mycena maculata TaxID=230809 RepID=A0AAD7IZB8_9AGAR|nr:hypothetical protein DFH07DRAFT_823835 [Mycena maculata]